MNQTFIGEVVLITGAASGLGAAIALRFSSLGAQLSLIDINWKGLQEIGEKCKENNKEKPLLIKADLTQEDDVRQIIEKTITEFGKVDILVNNAGIGGGGPIESTTLQQFDKIFNLNSRSVFYLTQLAIPHLIKSKGNIINMSSVVSVVQYPSVMAYSLSKSFVTHLTKNLALDLASKGVRVNSISPGHIMTNLYKSIGMSDEEVKAFFKTVTVKNPLGRAGQVEDVAKAVTFLASDDAEHITGVNLTIDGGKHLCGFPQKFQK